MKRIHFLIGGYPSGQEGLALTELSALVPLEKSSLVVIKSFID